MPQPQSLLKRNPKMTQEEFSTAWFRHGTIVLPYFLSYGVEYYAQIHAPLRSPSPALNAELGEWDGAAESIRSSHGNKRVLTAEEEAWRSAYYHEVILPDEKRFLVSPARDHLRTVEGVVGDKKVFLEGGKAMFDVPEDVMRVWRTYEESGMAKDKETGRE